MPKQKTHKGMKKRFTVTASGKIKHRAANRGHKLSHKSGKRKMQLRQDSVIAGTQAEMVVAALRPCM
ncbi:MAG: 50S ribosomal protein L35 [Planctomycetaceae bacterium]